MASRQERRLMREEKMETAEEEEMKMRSTICTIQCLRRRNGGNCHCNINQRRRHYKRRRVEGGNARENAASARSMPYEVSGKKERLKQRKRRKER